jgi:hypothetical protein
MQQPIRWEADIAFNNPFMRRQIFLGLTITFGLLWLILELISLFGRSHSSFTVAVVKRLATGSIPTEAWFALGFVFIIVIGTVILTKILMPSGYRAVFQIDDYGASIGPSASQKNMEKKLAWALVLGGAARRNPGAVGQGLMLGAQQGEKIAWSEVSEVELLPESSTIILHGKLRPVVGLVCPPENFENIVGWVKYYRTKEK